MNRFHILLFIIPLIIGSCKTSEIDNKIINQSIDSLNMNIFSNTGMKILSIKSPYSNFDNEKNVFNLKETTIKLFKDNEGEYIITSDNSKLSNNKLIELNGNVLVKTLIKQEDKLYANSFTWNIDNSEFLLVGNVRFKNNTISLSSNKAILNKNENTIKFFSPVKYEVKDGNNNNKYQVNSENAYYDIKTKSVNFSSNENRVRSKIYF